MAVKLLKGRDGHTWRSCWYGAFDVNGRRTVFNTGIRWTGTPPASGSLRDPGDAAFEASRERAESELAKFRDEAGRKGCAAHLVERLIESKTGRKAEHVRLDELGERWAATRTRTESKAWNFGRLSACEQFRSFMATRNPSAAYLYEVTTDDAGAFFKALSATFAPSTAHTYAAVVRSACDRLLPQGTVNPFDGVELSGRSEQVHRIPFTADELRALLDTARDDPFMHPLITTAVCTGLRRGDVCGLQWSAVDLDAGALAVKTSKTGSAVEIPIFAPLLAVLEGARAERRNGEAYVFPEAAGMLRENPTGLTWRFKKIVARAFGEDIEPGPEVDAAALAQQGADAIKANLPEGPRRERVLEAFRRYCEGQSVRDIEAATGCIRSTVSNDLHAVERWTGTRFFRNVRGAGAKAAVARVTRTERRNGRNAASVRDWHALRTTWVSIALSAGVPMELVRRVTGHATVDVVLRHYFRPGREDFKAALLGALPEVLTGRAKAPVPLRAAPVNELAELVGRVNAGTATAADGARLREWAAAIPV